MGEEVVQARSIHHFKTYVDNNRYEDRTMQD